MDKQQIGFLFIGSIFSLMFALKAIVNNATWYLRHRRDQLSVLDLIYLSLGAPILAVIMSLYGIFLIVYKALDSLEQIKPFKKDNHDS